MEKEMQKKDKELHLRASMRAWKTLQAEQGVSLRDVKVFLACMRGQPVKDIARAHDLTTRDVLQTVLRVDRIFRKHAHRHYQAALRGEVG